MFRKLSSDSLKKGSYNLFLAFGVEFLNVIYHFTECGYITKDTFENVKHYNKSFLEELYLQYIILQEPCSYDLTEYKQYLDVYYSEEEIRKGAYEIQLNSNKLMEIYIVANIGHEFEIKDQLLEMGMNKGNIIICNNEKLLQQMSQKVNKAEV